jgi:hypothetical protein
MVIWSILAQQAWEELQRKGRLRASRRHAGKDFLVAYDWMAGQMERRLAAPRPSKDAFPVWAWDQWEGATRRRPDLRASGHLAKGIRGVRVECRVDAGRVLLSEFDLWHYVLNYWYLPGSESDGKAFERKLAQAGLCLHRCDRGNPVTQAELRREIERSWQRILDVTWADRGCRIASPPEKKSIQATLWEIVIEDVVESTAFNAR